MDVNKTYNMTENLDLVITLIEDLKKQFMDTNESLQEVVKLVLNNTNSPNALKVLINDIEYRDSLRKALSDINYSSENNSKQISENYNRLIEILKICKVSIPLAKNEGKEII